MTTEIDYQNEMRLALGREKDLRLFRNMVGLAWQGDVHKKEKDYVVLRNPRRVSFGLAVGSSDLIGIKRVLITQAMVGSIIGQFISPEVKKPGETWGQNQEPWAKMIADFGGRSGIVTYPEDLRRLVFE